MHSCSIKRLFDSEKETILHMQRNLFLSLIRCHVPLDGNVSLVQLQCGKCLEPSSEQYMCSECMILNFLCFEVYADAY